MDVRVGLWRRLSAEELMCLNYGVGEDSWESLGLQGDPTINPKWNQLWIFIGRTDAKAEAPILWPHDAKSQFIRKVPDAGRRLKAGREGDDRGLDVWMASLTQWTWIWVSSRKWWRTEKPGVLQSTGSQRVGLDWVTEQQQNEMMVESPLQDFSEIN